MTDELKDKIIRILFVPETVEERIAHEVLEFFVYGNLYKHAEKAVKEFLE